MEGEAWKDPDKAQSKDDEAEEKNKSRCSTANDEPQPCAKP